MHNQLLFCVIRYPGFVIVTYITHLDMMNQGTAKSFCCLVYVESSSQIARFLGPTWGPPGSCWPQDGPMLAPGTLLSGRLFPHCVCRRYLSHMPPVVSDNPPRPLFLFWITSVTTKTSAYTSHTPFETLGLIWTFCFHNHDSYRCYGAK